LHTVPAAHPQVETDAEGHWKAVGYVIECAGRRFYHSGDTALTPLLFEHLERLKPLDIAILPVNEQNYYREQLGIIGNMGLRDAFAFARDLGVHTLVPMHWDMFEPNRVYREEIELFYQLTQPPFRMLINPDRL
jgi:L-ascorbate metabolism protein UlaG (beta-lactamase superfamily)